MPVQTDTPTSSGSNTEWKSYPNSVASRVAAVQSNNGDSSVIFAVSNAATKTQTFNFSPLLGVTDPVNSGSLSSVVRKYYQGSGAQTFKNVWNGTLVNFPSVDYGFAQQGILQFSYVTCTSDQPEISDLSVAAVNGEHGVRLRGTGGYELFVTHFYRSIDFDYAGDFAGPFTHNIGILAGAAIGAGLMLREMPRLACFMGRWVNGRRWTLRSDEFEAAWRAWREYRHPRSA